MNRILFCVALFALWGCSMFSGGKPYPLQETEPERVVKCRKIGVFPGPGGYRIWGPPPIMADFKLRSAEKAKEMGATHIYWEENVEGIAGGITGYAFDCTGVEIPWDDGEEEY